MTADETPVPEPVVDPAYIRPPITATNAPPRPKVTRPVRAAPRAPFMPERANVLTQHALKPHPSGN